MAIVSDCKYDVFVSYAHIDNEPAPGVDQGWVTTLVRHLERRMRQLCGRDFALWMDHELARHVQFSSQILDSLDHTASLMIVLSPGYLDSDWCQREREVFFRVVRERLNAGRSVFVVERDRIEPAPRPAELAEFLSIPFWQDCAGRGARILGDPKPNPDRDIDYYAKVNDLALEMRVALMKMTGHGRRVEPAVADRPAVYLAEATDDVDPLCEELRRYLDQFGIGTLPAKLLPRERVELVEAVNASLDKCLMFVQLLGQFPGKPSPGSDQSYVAIQHARALASGLPILQWRQPNLDLNSVAADHRRLLSGATVHAVGIEEFKRDVLNAARREIERRKQSIGNRPAAGEERLVFVNANVEDADLRDNVCQWLDQHGYAYVTPLYEGNAEEIRKDLEANLIDCDGALVVYGKITHDWVRGQLRQWHKVAFRRPGGKKSALAVYEGPPPEPKPPLGMKLPNMQVINCRDGLHEEELTKFLAALN